MRKGRCKRFEENKKMNKYLLATKMRYPKKEKKNLKVKPSCSEGKKVHDKKTLGRAHFFKYFMSASFLTLLVARPTITYKIHFDAQCAFDNNCLTRYKIQLLNFSTKFEKFFTRVLLCSMLRFWLFIENRFVEVSSLPLSLSADLFFLFCWIDAYKQKSG